MAPVVSYCKNGVMSRRTRSSGRAVAVNVTAAAGKLTGYAVTDIGTTEFELFFPSVHATDASAEQIRHAMPRPNIRYAAIFRGRHKDAEANGTEAMTDIWREWPGIREAVEMLTVV